MRRQKGKSAGNLCAHVTVSEVATVRKVESHETVVRGQQGRVNGNVRRGTGERLNVHAPFLRIEAECRKSTLLTQAFIFIGVLISTIIPCTWILSWKILLSKIEGEKEGKKRTHSFRIFVGEAGGKSVTDGTRANVLAGNHLESAALAIFFLLEDLPEFRVGFGEGARPSTGGALAVDDDHAGTDVGSCGSEK